MSFFFEATSSVDWSLIFWIKSEVRGTATDHPFLSLLAPAANYKIAYEQLATNALRLSTTAGATVTGQVVEWPTYYWSSFILTRSTSTTKFWKNGVKQLELTVEQLNTETCSLEVDS